MSIPKYLIPKVTFCNFVKMDKIAFPFINRKYTKGTFQEFDIYNSKTKSKYKIGKIYELRAKENNRTKKKLIVELTDIQIMAWNEVTNEHAGSVMIKIEMHPPFNPKKTLYREARKGDLMMFLMKQYEGKGFKGLSSQFQLLTFQITNNKPITKTYRKKTKLVDSPKENNIKTQKQITFPTFEDIKGDDDENRSYIAY